jgi:hypothetical protein
MEKNDDVPILQICITPQRLDKVERTNCSVVCSPSRRATRRGRYLIGNAKELVPAAWSH